MDSRPAPLRLLVVDDNTDTLRLFETYLSMSGFDVTATTNAVEALALSANGIEAISTDLAMPGMDGFEFIRRLRAARTKPPIPIVAVTGQGHLAASEPKAIGACRLLHKPCELGELADTLRELVRTCPHDCAACPDNPGPTLNDN